MVHSLAVHRTHMYSGDEDRMVYVWDLPSLKLAHTFAACDDIISALACTDTHLIAASFAVIKVCWLV